MRVATDPILAERLFHNARGEAPMWPSYGKAEAWYLAWAADEERIDSLLIISEKRTLDTDRLREQLSRELQQWVLGLSEDELCRPTCLCQILIFEGRPSVAYGALGVSDARCRPLSRLVERAESDLGVGV